MKSSRWFSRRVRVPSFAAAAAAIIACGGRTDGLPDGDSDPVEQGGQGGSAGVGGASGGPGDTIATGGSQQEPLCGNGRIDYGEECDGTNLNQATCQAALMSTYAAGTVRCVKCTLDVSNCTKSAYDTGGAPSGGFGGTGGIVYGGSGGSGGLPADPYTCLANQVSDPGPVVGMPPLPECGSYQGGPTMGLCTPLGVFPPKGNLTWPEDICGASQQCVPRTKVYDPASCFTPCNSPFGAGACLPDYIVDAQMAGAVSILGQGSCGDAEACAPCINPLNNMPTGACDN